MGGARTQLLFQLRPIQVDASLLCNSLSQLYSPLRFIRVDILLLCDYMENKASAASMLIGDMFFKSQPPFPKLGKPSLLLLKHPKPRLLHLKHPSRLPLIIARTEPKA